MATSSAAEARARPGGFPAYAVRRFTEKPGPGGRTTVCHVEAIFLECGNVFLARFDISGDSCGNICRGRRTRWANCNNRSARQRYARALKRNLSATRRIFPSTTRSWSPLRRRGSAERVFVLPANIGWSDIGSWAAVYELLARKSGGNVSAGDSFALDASGNFLVEPEEICGGDRRAGPGRGGNRRRAARLPARARAGRGQNREMARRKAPARASIGRAAPQSRLTPFPSYPHRAELSARQRIAYTFRP